MITITAIDLFEDAELLQRAQEEWQHRAKAGYTCPIEQGNLPGIL